MLIKSRPDSDNTSLTPSQTSTKKASALLSISKAFSLAGLRLGWIAAPAEVIQQVSIHRDYDTISVGIIDDYFASQALENKDQILARSKAIAKGNLRVLADWVEREPLITWTKPCSGTTALLKFDVPMSSYDLCVSLLKSYRRHVYPGLGTGHGRICTHRLCEYTFDINARVNQDD